MKLSLPLKTIDWVLAILPLILLSIGIAVIFSLSNGGGKNIALNQGISVLIGIVAAIILMFVDYRTWKSLTIPIYLAGVISLVTVIFLGSRSFGATRWIDFGFFQFQPSEVMKIALVIVLAKMISSEQIFGFKFLFKVAAVVIFPVALVLSQPDLGSASVMLFTSFILVATSGVSKKIIFGGILIALLCLPLAYQFIQPYQKERVKTFLEPDSDPSGAGYNVSQSKIAIGSGGVWGRGLGQGSQSQLNFLPVAHTDFIFAGIAEATGFVGSVTVLILISIVIYRSVMIARLSQDLFGMYLALGLASIYLYQTFVNAGGNLGLVPVTGIPLPFVSFGGTATIVFLSGIGILESIYLRHKKIRFE